MQGVLSIPRPVSLLPRSGDASGKQVIPDVPLPARAPFRVSDFKSQVVSRYTLLPVATRQRIGERVELAIKHSNKPRVLTPADWSLLNGTAGRLAAQALDKQAAAVRALPLSSFSASAPVTPEAIRSKFDLDVREFVGTVLTPAQELGLRTAIADRVTSGKDVSAAQWPAVAADLVALRAGVRHSLARMHRDFHLKFNPSSLVQTIPDAVGILPPFLR